MASEFSSAALQRQNVAVPVCLTRVCCLVNVTMGVFLSVGMEDEQFVNRLVLMWGGVIPGLAC